MKKKISLCCLVALSFFSPLYALKLGLRKDFEESFTIQNAVPLLEQSKNSAKGLETLKSLEDRDSIRLILAYCYENALGCEKDDAKVKEYLSSISNANVVEKTISFLNNEKNFSFALKIADFSYAKYGNLKDAYSPLIHSFYFRKQEPARYAELLALLEENLEENANLLFKTYIYKGRYRKAISFMEYVDFAELAKGRALQDAFARILRDGDAENLEKFIEHTSSFIEELEAEKVSAMTFYLSFCKKYGYGIEKDEKAGSGLYEKYASLPINRISEYDVNQLALSPFKEAGDFVFSLAKDLEKRGDNSLYIHCTRQGFGTQKDLAKCIELSYENIANSKQKVSYTIIPDFLNLYKEGKSTKRLEEIAYDAVSRELDNNVLSHLDVFYNLILLGYGKDSDKAKVFTMKKLMAERIKEPSYIESLAYFYDNGIGCEKDTEKAKELRLEIDKIITEKYPNDISTAYFTLVLSVYTSDKNNLRSIYAPEMIKHYR